MKNYLLKIPDDVATWRWMFWLLACFGLITVFGSVSTAILGVLALFAVLLRFADAERFTPLPHEKVMTWVVITYVAISAILSLIQPNIMDAFEYIVNNFTFFFLLAILPIARVYSKAEWIRNIYIAISCGLIVSSLVLLFELNVLKIVRPHAFVANALVLAAIAAGFTLFALNRACETSGRERYLHLTAFVAGLIIIFITGSRGAALALPIASIVILFLHRQIFINHIYRVIIFILIVMTVFAILIFWAMSDPDLQRIVNRFNIFYVISQHNTPSLFKGSIQMRLEMIEGGWHAFLQSPWIGHGRQNIMTAAANAIGIERYRFTHLHNPYMTEMVASGISGLLSFLAVCLLPVYVTWKSSKNLRQFGIAFSICWCITILTNIGFYHDLMIVYFSLSLLFLCLQRNHDQHLAPQ